MTGRQTSLVDALLRAMEEHAERDAIETVDGVLTYRELGKHASDLAARLEALTAPDEFFGIEAERTSASIVAMVGALVAGRPFVFIDPRDSESSNTTKVSLLGVRLLARSAPGSPAAELVPPPAEWGGGANGAEPVRGHGRIGYAIHTSGSTGEPKCVLVRADPLAPMIEDHVRVLELDTRSRTLQFARLTFDGCITEILWTLTSGACLVIVPETMLSPGTVLRDTLRTYRITHLKTTPFALTATEPTSGMTLRHVVNGGGACRPAVLRAWSAVAAFHNAYGLTETTVCNLLTGVLDPGECTASVPLGEIVGDCAYEIAPLPSREGAGSADAERGELVIRGESVAVGYLTAEGLRPFLDDEGRRVYRTGDIVERRDGRLYYVERLDRQLKVRGYRLDPGEVENAACRLDGVAEAVVVAEAHEADEAAGGTGDDALVCYYQGSVTSRELRAHLEAVLDAYKVPSVITQVEAMPYTRNGKVDRDALRTSRRAARAEPAELGPAEQVLELVRRLTGVTDATADDNFFMLGGDSASTVLLVNKLKELGWMDAGVRDVLRAENLRALTDRLTGQGV